MVDLCRLGDSENPKVRELCQKLVQGVERTLAEGKLAEFLKFAARFRKYSPANVALIFAQKPDATLVAGIKTWNDLGRRVKKGEKGIAIFAPTVRKVKVRAEEIDPATGEVREVEREEERLVGFHVAHVFDVSQTEGKPLPELPEPQSLPDSAAAARICNRLAKAGLVIIAHDCDLPRGAKGEFDPRTWEVRISREVRTTGDLARTLLHEYAHALAFKLGVDSLEMRQGSEGTQREMYARGEAIAEGAAFMAAACLGLDTFGMSTEYIAGYVRRAGKLVQWLEAIQKVAGALISLIEGADEGRAAA